MTHGSLNLLSVRDITSEYHTGSPSLSLTVFCLHSYHHAFPQDYATGEFGIPLFDLTYFIDAMAMLGQAYNLKRTSPVLVETTKVNTAHKKKMNCLKNSQVASVELCEKSASVTRQKVSSTG